MSHELDDVTASRSMTRNNGREITDSRLLRVRQSRASGKPPTQSGPAPNKKYFFAKEKRIREIICEQITLINYPNWFYRDPWADKGHGTQSVRLRPLFRNFDRPPSSAF